MYSYSKFTKHVFIVGLVNLLGVFQSIIFLPIITKILGAESYGVWTQLKITLGLLVPFTFLGLNDALVRFLPGAKDKEESREGIYSSLAITFGVAMVTALVLLIFSGPISLFLRFDPVFIRLLSLVVIFESLDTTLLTIIQARREIERYILFIILKMLGETGLIIGAISLGYGLYGAVIAFLAIRVIIFLIVSVYILRGVGIKIPNFSLAKKYLRFGLPTIANGISYWIVTSVDRYIIGFFLGVLFIGYYAPAYSVGMLLLFFAIPVGFVLSAVLPKFFDENDIDEVQRYLSNSLKYYLLIMIPSVFGISVLARGLLTALSTEEIATNAYFVVPFIAVGMLLYGVTSLISHVLLLVKKTKLIAVIWVIAAFLNLGLNILFIPLFGIVAAAIITLISYLFALILIWYFAFKEFKFIINWNFITKSVVASVFMGFLIRWINPSGLSSIIIAIVSGGLTYCALMFLLKGVGKKEINFTMSLIKNIKGYKI